MTRPLLHKHSVQSITCRGIYFFFRSRSCYSFFSVILFFSFNSQIGFDELMFEATTHSKFNIPIPIQLASAYIRVEAINSTQNNLKETHKKNNETDFGMAMQ